jgi:hypothetical protein
VIDGCEPTPSDDQLTINRQIAMRFRKIIIIVLCTFFLLFAYCLGCLHGVQRREELTQRAGVYVYDTQQKLDAHFKMMKQVAEKLPSNWQDTGFP